MTVAQRVAAPLVDEDSRIIASLWRAIESDFLTLMSWQPEMRVLTFPRSHPLLGVRVCVVLGCEQTRSLPTTSTR